MAAEILTVGHSNHTLETFLGLLLEHSVTVVADVRSTPYSKYAPQYRKELLQPELAAAGIRYVFLGKELGARSSDPNCYVDGRVSYHRLARTDQFALGINQIVTESATEKIAIMCTEKDPLDCHRTLLVSRVLHNKGMAVSHILADTSIESYQASTQRLLNKLGMEPADLFTSEEERIAEAMDIQETRIAYVDENLANARNGTRP